MGKYYKVSEEELKRLIERDFELSNLEEMGVDNWEGYGEIPDEDEDIPTTEEYIELTFQLLEEEN